MRGGGEFLEDGRGGLAHLCLVQSFEMVHKLGQCHLIFFKTVIGGGGIYLLQSNKIHVF